eukprot:Anaeramoba_ignava/a348602_37.p4 GENE.a348602_37~~a348602_37.p4  ORF type:complete len:185 (+),score=-7.44 a348602_37:1711-2265(+)
MSDKDNKQLFGKNMDIHMRISTWLFFGTVSLVALLSSFIFYQGDKLPVIVVVILAGFMGGFVSSLTRVHQFKKLFPKDAYDELKKISRFKVVVFSLIPPLVGGIAAVVLYEIFAGGMLEGNLFPRFAYEDGFKLNGNFLNIVSHWKPEGAPDYIKSIVWGFIAGFSERFVPSILDGFTNGKDEK